MLLLLSPTQLLLCFAAGAHHDNGAESTEAAAVDSKSFK